MITPQIVAYQGREGAYSHLSCRRVFPDMQPHACDSFIDAMLQVERGHAQLAMIPLENSTAGRVEELYRLLPAMQLHIIAEHFESVNHCLLAKKGVAVKQLKTISSHPQALAQCDNHISELGLKQIAAFDTAGSAAELSQSSHTDHAVIASSLAAELYDLQILRENFQDVTGNTTRFIILSKEGGVPAYSTETPYITSLMFTVRDIPAALYKALGGFATNGVNVVKLESYMNTGSAASYSFHLDFEGHPEERMTRYSLKELAFFAKEIRNLGTYEAHAFRLLNQPTPE